MVVFVDGRMLRVAGASLTDRARVRLELPGGGSLDVPVARVDHVIEIQPVPVDVPAVAKPSCPSSYADQPLPEATPFRSDIVAAAKRYDLHPWLVAAVVEVESGFDRWAVSRVGARGLMQLMPAVWMDGGIVDPHDPRANLRVGCAHLRALIDRFKDLRLALAAYNAGATVVERFGGVPPFRETRDYVERVLALFCPPAGSTDVGR